MGKDHFEVLCVSTASAGKSMLLNALMGRHLLPTRSSLCTTKVHRLFHPSNGGPVRCRCRTSARGRTPWKECSRDLLTELGRGAHQEIEMDVCFPNIRMPKKRSTLCLIDTPGTNSTCVERHADIGRTLLASSDYQGLIVVMNGIYQGSTDEGYLLEQVREGCSRARNTRIIPLFALSMLDRLNVEESPVERVQETHVYLESLGFKKPVVIPVMAQRSLLIRTLLQRYVGMADSDEIHEEDLHHLQRQIPRYEKHSQVWLDAQRVGSVTKTLAERVALAYAAKNTAGALQGVDGIGPDQLFLQDQMTGIPLLEVALGECMERWSSREERSSQKCSPRKQARKQPVVKPKISARSKQI